MKKMHLSFLGLILIAPAYAQDIPRKIDDLISTYVSWNKFTGSVLVAEKGKILFEKGYGLKNAADQTANDPNTLFLIGSLTKTFTAAVVLKLAEQKKLRLTDKLSKYFPDFPKGDSITIKNLLTHSSGIFNYGDTKDFFHLSSLPTNEQNVLDSLMEKPLLFPPGAKYSYSNSNYMLLAYIIQKITHRSYESVVRDWIFRPLGMSHSGFDFTGLKDPDKATGYWDYSAAKITEARSVDSTQFIGSGEIYSSVGDLYKWHLALQSGKILSKASLEEAYRPFMGNYGYGWELDTLYHRNIVGHAGRMWGFEAKMLRVPEDDVFIILLNNRSDGPYLDKAAKKIMAILYGQPYISPDPLLALSEDTLNAYTGFYSLAPGHNFEVRLVKGHVFGIAGNKMLELLPFKKDYFLVMEGQDEESDMEFGRDDSGKIDKMIANEHGQKLIAKKIFPGK